MSEKHSEGKIGYSTSAEFGPNDILYMLRDLPDACCIFKVLTDPFGTVKDMLFLYANEKYAQLVNKPVAELVGATYYQTVSNQDEDWIRFSYQAAVLRQSSINRTYNSAFNKWFEFWVVPVYQKGFCAFIIHDVTADKRNEETQVYEANTNNLVIDCAKAIATPDFNKGLKRVLRKIGQAIDADRVYVVTSQGTSIKEIHEWVSKSCTIGLPPKKVFEKHDLVGIWNRNLTDKSVFYMHDVTPVQDINEPLYNELLAGKCSRFMVTKLKDKDEDIGFLVADNYSLEIQVNLPELMETVAAFVAGQLRIHDLTKELMYLGGHDALTGLGNRYALNQTLLLLSEMSVPVGVCYTDINGLKAINDDKGHEEGDRLIGKTAEVIGAVFKSKYCYRIGGDEFVAIIPDIEEEKFEELVDKLKNKTKGDAIAIGHTWSRSTKDIKKTIRSADEDMYKDKARYYKDHERRHANNT
jgi:diguanylate cyclase (GGDEF)-like protein